MTKDLKASDRKDWTVGSETYSSLVENNFIPATLFPETGFAVTIDKASYSNVRPFFEYGQYHSAGCGADRRAAKLLQFRVYRSACGQLFCLAFAAIGMSVESG